MRLKLGEEATGENNMSVIGVTGIWRWQKPNHQLQNPTYNITILILILDLENTKLFSTINNIAYRAVSTRKYKVIFDKLIASTTKCKINLDAMNHYNNLQNQLFNYAYINIF